MESVQRSARRAGAIYFIFMIVSIIGEFVMPKFLAPGDAAATAQNITENEGMYRLVILNGLVSLVLFIFLVASLYKLFRDVDPGQTMLMVLTVAAGIALALANMVSRFAPLLLLNGADYMAAFTKPQLQALAHSALRFHSSGAAIAMTFWGLWLFPFGMLVVRSGFLPRILGILLWAAGVGYVITSVTSIVLPEYRSIVSQWMMPLYFGEMPIIFWLLFKGAKVDPATL